MSIKAYVGRMGSGKTYEVVSVVILGALRRGRRVVSNIAGLHYDAMKALLIEEGIAEDKIGQIVPIDHQAALDPLFWRTDKDAIEGTNSFIQPGDLVALDEIWRFWDGFGTKDADGKKRPDRVMNFFRMHRHFTHPETGVSCDVALITQDVMDISRQVRAVIEETYYMEKLTAIGSTKRYRVDIHQGGKIARKPLKSLQRSYEAKYFPLYSSHSQKKEGDADAVEENIDKRGNILTGILFRVVLPVGAVVLLLAVFFLYRFLHPSTPKPRQAVSDAPAVQTEKVSQAKPPSPVVSDEWRAGGYWIENGGVSFFVTNDIGHSRVLADVPGYRLSALTIEVMLPSGEFATSWSGGRRMQGNGGLPK